MKHKLIGAAASLMAIVATSGAHGAEPDKDRLLDLRQPAVVAQALRDAGFKGELKTRDDGDPYVLSAANGSGFTIEFYNCTKKVDCTSYQFASWYKAEPIFTAALANEWNAKKRFLKIAVDADGNLNEWMDFSSVGKTTFANFADQVDWYQVMDTDLGKFLVEHRDAKRK